jgi:hypothetical protein
VNKSEIANDHFLPALLLSLPSYEVPFKNPFNKKRPEEIQDSPSLQSFFIPSIFHNADKVSLYNLPEVFHDSEDRFSHTVDDRTNPETIHIRF